MEQIIITHKNGTTLKLNSKENVSAITKATQQVELLGVDIVDISVESANKMNFILGDKITVIGRDYTLNTPARERKISESHFVYDMQFEGVQYDLLRANFNVNVDTTSNAIQDISGDSITGDIKIFLDVLIANANRVFGAGKWVVGTYPANTKTVTLSFSDSDNCLTVLQTLCGEDNFGTEFNIAIDGTGKRTINIGAIGNTFGHTFEYGKGKGIYELTREKVSSSNIITRLNCFGGSKNIITPKYRASKLCLATKSKSQSYIEDAAAIATYGVWENTKEFDDIYPHRTGVISSLGANVFEFIDSSMDFDLNELNVDGTTKYLMAGTSAKVHFNTGNLAGYEFEVNNYNAATKKFTITSQTDQNDYAFPSTTTAAFQLGIGDEYIITDIYMPQSYIDTAEAALATKAAAYLAKYSQPLVQYGLTIDSFFLKNQVGAEVESNIVWVGDYIPIKDIDIDVDKTIRVKGFTRDLMLDYAYQLTIADLSVTVSIIDRVVSGMNTVDKVIKINNLNDPARARRNWNYSQELLNMVFDPEGDYYTEKIKPLSIETTMLSVGSKSMQFGLEGTIFQPNYAANKNRVVYVGGSLVHYTVLDSGENPRVWNITGGDVVIADDAARYVYAKCAKVGAGASILFSTAKITVESDASYYHFLIGILNSADVNNTRALALMYGFTTVNGRFIKTGRIQSADGVTYFDLDSGEFKGNFKFTSGTSVETAVSTAQSAANAAQTTANNITVGGRNYIQNSEAEREFSNSLEIPLSMFSAGETISLSFFGKYATGGTESWSFLVKNTGTGTSGTNLLNIPVNENSYTYKSGTITLPATLDNLRIVCNNVGAYAYHGFLKLIKVEKGNKPTDWTAAPEDITASINAIQIGGRNLYSGTWKDDKAFGGVSAGYCFPIGYKTLVELGVSVGETVTISSIATLTGASVYKTIFAFSNGTTITYVLGTDVASGTRSTLTSVIPAGTTNFAFYYSFSTSATILNCKLIKLERGNRATDWNNEVEYLSAAMQANTTIDGGLLSTTLIQVKDVTGNVTGGLSGLSSDNVVLFGGGTYADALASATTPAAVAVIDRKDGSGHRAKGALLWDKLGNLTVGLFKVVSGAITGYEGLYERLRLTTQAITTLTVLTTGGWIREAKDYLFSSEYAGWVYNGGPEPSKTVTIAKTSSSTLIIPSATNIKIYSGGVLSYSLTAPTGITFDTIIQQFVISGVGTYPLIAGANQTIALAAGSYNISYSIEATFDVMETKSSQVNLSNTTAAYVEVQSIAPSRTEIGSDGFFSFWSTVQYFYYDKINGLSVKGTTNIPGVLATGSISSTGVHSNKWGAKISSSNATYTATGIYDVIHTVGATAYTVMLTPSVDGNRASIISKSATSFRVQVRNSSNTIIAGAFDYMIIGTN